MGVYENTLKDIEKTMGIVPGFMKGLPKDVLIQEWPLSRSITLKKQRYLQNTGSLWVYPWQPHQMPLL